MNWTTEFENQPVDGSNPGFIAQSVRNLKTGISERITNEHFYGNGESTYPGRHREGSARIYVVDDESSSRTDQVSTDDLVGRIRANLEERSVTPEVDTVDVTGDQVYERNIDIRDKDGNWVTLFDPDEYVHRNWDLDILGRKRFTSENPEVQEALDDTTYDAMIAADQARADEKAVKRSDIKDWTNEAFAHNIFDVTDDDNSDYVVATTSGDANPITGTAFTIDRNISANKIYADGGVYGAVWV